MVLVQTTLEGARLEVEKLNLNMEQAKTSLSELNRLLVTYLSLARRFGLPDEIMSAIAKIQQLRVTLMAAYQAMKLTQAAILAGGPIAWALAIGGLGLTAFMATDFMMDL